MGKVLRVVSGPHRGSVFVLRSRTVIGRAGHADIQLIDQTVSRQHVKLVVDGTGQVTLMDLASDNGTFVNGEAVRRRVLELGDTIEVSKTQFVFEEGAESTSSRVFSSKVTSTASLRQTAPHATIPRAEAAASRRAAGGGPGEYFTRGGREHIRTPGSLREPRRGDRHVLDGVDVQHLDPVGPSRAAPPRPRPAPRPAMPRRPDRAAAGWPASTALTSGAPRAPDALIAEPAIAIPAEALHGASREATVGLGPGATDVAEPFFPVPTPEQEARLGVPGDVTEPPLPSSPPAPVRGWSPLPSPTAERPRRRTTSEYPVTMPPDEPPMPRRASPVRAQSRKRATAEIGTRDDLSLIEDPVDVDVLPDVGEVAGLDVFLDVVEYRELRIRMLRGPALNAHERATFRTLERRLERSPEHGDDASLQRRFHRFDCVLRAALRVRGPDGPAVPARVVDLSAGGAQILLGGTPVEPGDTVWLSVELVAAQASRALGPSPRPITLECRVVWGGPRGARIGVIFAGRPRVQS